MDSILITIKKMLGLEEGDISFDTDVIVALNSSFMVLTQLGVGPSEGFSVTDVSQKWEDFLGTSTNLDAVKSYLYLKTRLLFDPPSPGYVLTAMENVIKEFEWRLMVQVDPPLPLPEGDTDEL